MHGESVPLGKAAILNGQFVNEAGAPTDPGTIVLTVTHPDGTVDTHNAGALVHTGPGRYQYHQTANATGVWTFTYEGSGNGVDAIDTDYFLCGVTLHPGPCENWIAPEEVFGCGPCAQIAPADQDLGLALTLATAASEFYWMHSGRQFGGLCQETVRPCCHDMDCGRQVCGCPDPIMLALPRPLRGIIEVRQDGHVLPASAYHVDQSRWAVRDDGEPWPCCQDMRADPLTDVNTLQFKIVRGTPPPELGVLAAAEMACELYQGCSGGDCSIPQRVTNIARQGVTMQFIRPVDVGLSNDNRQVNTGLKIGQLFLATYGTTGRRQRPAVASPDIGPSVWRVST